MEGALTGRLLSCSPSKMTRLLKDAAPRVAHAHEALAAANGCAACSATATARPGGTAYASSRLATPGTA
jgi:hypothetical protein